MKVHVNNISNILYLAMTKWTHVQRLTTLANLADVIPTRMTVDAV